MEKLNIKETFRTIKMIHFSLLAGMLVFLAITFFITKNHFLSLDTSTGDVFLYVLPMLAIFSIGLGNFLFNMKIKEAKKADTLLMKLTDFQTSSLIKAATIEGVVLFSVVCFLLTSNLLYPIIAVAFILYFLSTFPTIPKIIRALDLNSEEQDQLYKK